MPDGKSVIRTMVMRLDANHRMGLGHATRVSSLLTLLQFPYRVAVAGAGKQLATYFPGARLHEVSPEEPESFFELINEEHPDLILVDHPNPGYGFWVTLRAYCGDIPVVAIDDFGGDVDADIVINGTVVDEYHHYPVLRPHAKLLVGKDYALIRPVFGKTPWQNSADPFITIVIGGGARACEWALHLVSGVVKFGQWGKVRMIVGGAFPEMEKLRQGCNARNILLESEITGEKMAEALSQASVVLITGGMIVYEAVAVGVPAVVFPQMKNQIREAHWFAARGCILDLGYVGGMDADLLSEAVGTLLSFPSKRLAMSTAQRETIDGNGMIRAARTIDDLLGNDAAKGWG